MREFETARNCFLSNLGSGIKRYENTWFKFMIDNSIERFVRDMLNRFAAIHVTINLFFWNLDVCV